MRAALLSRQDCPLGNTSSSRAYLYEAVYLTDICCIAKKRTACCSQNAERIFTLKPTATTYCLKLDVRKFFDNVNKQVLKNQLAHIIKCRRTLDLLSDIIDSRPSGIPIGNYTSQFFGNLYLSSLDHYLKEVEGLSFYLRYMDDMVILSDSKERLHEILETIRVYLRDNLHLSIKKNYQIFNVEERGIDFVGYRIRHNYILLRTSTKKRLKKKAEHLKKKQNAGKSLTLSDQCAIGSYQGVLMPGDCYHLTEATIGGFIDDKNRKRDAERKTRRNRLSERHSICA